MKRVPTLRRWSTLFGVILGLAALSPQAGELQEAVKRGRLEEARKLLASGADPNETDSLGGTPLLGTAIRGEVAMARLLLELGADPEAGSGPFTALMAAAMHGHIEIVEALLDHGANPQRKNSLGQTAIDFARQNRRTGIVELLTGKRRPSRPSPGGDALREAAVRGDVAAVTRLLDEGADVNARSARGVTALHEAARSGWVDVAKLLLARGAAIEAESEEGMTALRDALKAHARLGPEAHRHHEPGIRAGDPLAVARLLLQAGADPNRKAEGGGFVQAGSTAFTQVAIAGDSIALKLLASARGGREGLPRALGAAATTGKREIIETLIALGVSLDAATDEYGNTALIVAATVGDVSLVSFLLGHPAAGRTPPTTRLASGAARATRERRAERGGCPSL